MAEQINVRREGKVEIIEFNNPPMNFISRVMLRELYEELLRAKADSDIRVLVLTGGMEDSFITHYDVGELVDYSENSQIGSSSMLLASLLYWGSRLMGRFPTMEINFIKMVEKRPPAEQGIMYWSRCMELLDTMPKPVIAAISGLCLGGGCETSLCCDFRYMARGEHYYIGLPEVLVGIIPGGTGTPIRLPRIVGEAKALEMLLTGNLYTPDEAEAMGLIHKAVDPDDLLPIVMELAERLAGGAPIAQACIKKDVRLGSRLSYHTGRVLDLAMGNAAILSDDAKRGMRGYVEIISSFTSFDLERVMKVTEDLRAGRVIEYTGS